MPIIACSRFFLAVASRRPSVKQARRKILGYNNSSQYAERVPDPEYPLYRERSRDGSLQFQGRQLHPSQALAGEAVGERAT